MVALSRMMGAMAGMGFLAMVAVASCGSSDNNNGNVDMAPVSTPTLQRATPASGAIAGGAQVTLMGSGFLDGATVKFGGVAATNVQVQTPFQLVATVPAYTGPLGLVNVTVQNPDGGSVVRGDIFSYVRALVTFAQNVTRTVGTGPVAIAAEDINGDGGKELLIVNGTSGDVTVLLANLTLQQNGGPYSTAVGPTSIAVADINGDGNKDLVIGCSNGSSQDVSVLRGSGNGSFLAPVHFAVGQTVTGVVVKDFDGDGKIDVAASVRSQNKVYVLTNSSANPSVSFILPATSYPVGNQPVALLLGDLTKDGKEELISATYSDNQVGVLTALTGGTFSTPVKVATVGTNPIALAMAELSGDSNPDLVVANFTGNTLSLLKGQGDGTFSSVSTLPTSDKPSGVALTDLDGDGKQDIIVTNSGNNAISVLLGKGDGTFEPAQIFPVGTQPWALIAADLDRDGKIDLATANLGSNDVTILYNLTVR